MSEPAASLSSYWEQQRQKMAPRPRGRGIRELQREAQAPHPLPKSAEPAAAEPQPAQPSLDELREKAERVGAWLLANDPGHPRWGEGADAYTRLQQQIQELEDGQWHYLRQPGDDYSGIVVFPADYAGPLLGGTWQRLADGSIEARLSLFQLRIMRELRAMMESTESTEEL